MHNWKRRALSAEKIVREYHTTEKKQAMQLSDDKDTVPRRTTPELGSGDDGPSHCRTARGHHYSVFIIQLAVAFVVYCLNSFRGAARNFALLSS